MNRELKKILKILFKKQIIIKECLFNICLNSTKKEGNLIKSYTIILSKANILKETNNKYSK